jgi:hypothetical protein
VRTWEETERYVLRLEDSYQALRWSLILASREIAEVTGENPADEYSRLRELGKKRARSEPHV